MKFIDKILYFINSIFALCLLLSLFVPYFPPQKFPILSVFSIMVSPLLLVNVFFFLFWLLRVKRQLFLSLIILIISFVQFNHFYQFDFSKEIPLNNNHLKVMTYNVRLFNLYEWIKDENVQWNISNLIKKENPDVLSFQEYHTKKEVELSQYPYNYEKFRGKSNKSGQAIYSKYPIVNKGSIDFKDTFNNAIFVDIIKQEDTIRIYNIHLESLQINPDDVDFDQENSERLLRRIAGSFKEQQLQTDKVVSHITQSPYKTIITADLNNTAFSYVYRQLKKGKIDAFAEAGKGLGKTFSFKKIPLRIDFIIADKEMQVQHFTTHTEKYSDHHPISATLTWE